jgi:hypothetical protein
MPVLPAGAHRAGERAAPHAVPDVRERWLSLLCDAGKSTAPRTAARKDPAGARTAYAITRPSWFTGRDRPSHERAWIAKGEHALERR